jgi:hypothetical protein
VVVTGDALPVIVTHGWPGSIIEQLKIIEPLTNPTAHGGSAADAFDVVIPSMPDVAQGGDWGTPRSWTEKAYRNLIYFNRAERGGHFAAWEQPQLFSEELRAAFRPLR